MARCWPARPWLELAGLINLALTGGDQAEIHPSFGQPYGPAHLARKLQALMYDLLGLLPGMLSITKPGVAGGRVKRELARIKEAANGAEAIARVEHVGADVILMDLRMPEMSGVEAITRLRRTAPAVRVLVLTTYDTDSDVLAAIEAGATGYLLKDAPREELIRAVRAAFAGEAVLSPAVARRLMGQVGRPPPEALSQRELEVLALIADGATNRQAAAKLFISEATVKTHLLHVYEKLDVRDRAAAVAEAYRRRLLT